MHDTNSHSVEFHSFYPKFTLHTKLENPHFKSSPFLHPTNSFLTTNVMNGLDEDSITPSQISASEDAQQTINQSINSNLINMVTITLKIPFLELNRILKHNGKRFNVMT